jgi:hypothetical protein
MFKKILLITISLFLITNAFPCTIFYFVKDGKAYFCNNEDFSNPDTEIRFYPAKFGKYAWVYFGFSNDWAQGGVNEKGLCWDWVAGYEGTGWEKDKSKKTFNGNLSEKIITKCTSVEEAIKYYEKYNEESFSYARIMLADKYGNSAIVGWKNGKFFVERNQNKLHAFGYKGDSVYSYFSNNQQDKNIHYFSKVLDVAHQEGVYPTQYSNIISLDDGKIYLYKSHDFSSFVEINYLERLKEKFAKFKISELFNENRKSKYMIFRNEYSQVFD